MDPLAAFRGDIELARLDPFQRALVAGARADAIEEREAAERRAARRDAAEAERMRGEAVARTQIAMRGYSDAELLRHQAEQRARHQEAIDEAWATIERLDPRAAAARRAELDRASQLTRMDATLAQARRQAADPFMRDQIMRYHERGAARESAARRAKIAELEAAGAAGRPEITRTYPPFAPEREAVR